MPDVVLARRGAGLDALPREAAVPREATVGALLSSPVLTVEVGESLWDAWQLLFVSGLRHLAVVDAGACVAVVGDRLLLSDLPLTAEHLGRRRVGDVLPRVPLLRVPPGGHPLDAARLMARHGVDALPVVDHRGRLVGVLTESDLVRWVAAQPGGAAGG